MFPDFFKNQTVNVWKALINESIQRLPVNGLWIVSDIFLYNIFLLKGQ